MPFTYRRADQPVQGIWLMIQPAFLISPNINKHLNSHNYVHMYRVAREKKVPSAGSRENYQKVMRQAEDETFHHGYDVGKIYR